MARSKVLKLLILLSLFVFTTGISTCESRDDDELVEREIIDSGHKNFSDRESLTILIYGDAGTGKEDQYIVGSSMYKVCQEQGCDFAMSAGDNIYQYGVQSVYSAQWDTKFELPYKDFGRFDFWMTPGNHDWEGDTAEQIKYTRYSDRWRMPDLHYEIPDLPDWLHIYSLNTDFLDATQVQTVKDTICHKTGWKMIFGHHPIYSYGSGHGDEPGFDELLKPLTDDCTQIYLAGHDHHQEHISGKTFEQIISGAAGKLRSVSQEDFDGVRRQNFAVAEYGFGILKMDAVNVELVFYDGSGAELYKWATTIDKIGFENSPEGTETSPPESGDDDDGDEEEELDPEDEDPQPTPTPNPSNNPHATYTWLNENVFQPKCVACHGPGLVEDDVRLDTYDNLKGFGEYKDVTEFDDDAEDAELYEEVQDVEMPPVDAGFDAVTAGEMQAILDWLNSGSPNN